MGILVQTTVCAIQRRILLPVALIAGGVLLCLAGEENEAPPVATGQTPAEIIEQLGRPRGKFQVGKRLTYYYEQGMVDFLDGRVVKATILSPAELRRKREAEIEARRAAEAERQRITDEGDRELARALADPALQQRSPAERIAFWTAFKKRYPYTNVGKPLAEAAVAMTDEKAKRERADRAAAAESRVEEIRARLKQLDDDYAASLTHWKRNEIDAERVQLKEELDALTAGAASISKER